MRGKKLYIVTDCCYSGNWVMECAKSLDRENIYCGHDAELNQIYLKVFAACLPHQRASDPLYAVGEGVKLFTHRGSQVIGFGKHRVLDDSQTTLGFDFTSTKKCTVNENECTSPNSTWEQDVEDLILSEPTNKYLF